MAGDNMVTAFIAAGGGTVLGSIVTAFIQSMGSRGKDRAEAADKSVTAAGHIIDRLTEENLEMRKAIILVSELLDDIISNLPMDGVTKSKLREANKAVKLAAV